MMSAKRFRLAAYSLVALLLLTGCNDFDRYELFVTDHFPLRRAIQRPGIFEHWCRVAVYELDDEFNAAFKKAGPALLAVRHEIQTFPEVTDLDRVFPFPRYPEWQPTPFEPKIRGENSIMWWATIVVSKCPKTNGSLFNVLREYMGWKPGGYFAADSGDLLLYLPDRNILFVVEKPH